MHAVVKANNYFNSSKPFPVDPDEWEETHQLSFRHYRFLIILDICKLKLAHQGCICWMRIGFYCRRVQHLSWSEDRIHFRSSVVRSQFFAIHVDHLLIMIPRPSLVLPSWKPSLRHCLTADFLAFWGDLSDPKRIVPFNRQFNFSFPSYLWLISVLTSSAATGWSKLQFFSVDRRAHIKL